jgi:hypothetical protein
MVEFGASRNTQLAPPTRGRPSRNGTHRLRDDHPLGARYQMGAVEYFAAYPNRQFLLRSSTLAGRWWGFLGKRLPKGYKAVTLARYDGDAVLTAFSGAYPIDFIFFAIPLRHIPKYNAMNDTDLLAVWDRLDAEGWPRRRGKYVAGDEHKKAFERHVKVVRAAIRDAEEDAIPIPDEVARQQIFYAELGRRQSEEWQRELERREAEQRGASNGRDA